MDGDDLEEYNDRFQINFEDLENRISLLATSEEYEKETIIHQTEAIIYEIKQDINTYTGELEILDYKGAKYHRQKCKIHEVQLDKLEEEFEQAKNKARKLDENIQQMLHIPDEEIIDKVLATGTKQISASKKKAGDI